MRGIVFVTGTDTDAGKTFVSCSLLRALRQRGVRVAARKPVESGCARAGGQSDGETDAETADELIPSDAIALRAAAGGDEPLDSIISLRLEEALAPGVAAERAGVSLDVEACVEECRRRAAEVDLLLVEGAGGLLVPLAGEVDCAEFARRLGASLLVVVGVKLGGINHALLTLEAARRRGLPIEGMILTHPSRDTDTAKKTFRETLARLDETPILAEIPFADSHEAGAEILARSLA